MARRIAVQEGLDNVAQALQKEGFEVTRLTQGPMGDKVAAAVVSGMSNNLLGIHDTDGNKFPVVDAAGKSAEEVISQLHTHLNQT